MYTACSCARTKMKMKTVTRGIVCSKYSLTREPILLCSPQSLVHSSQVLSSTKTFVFMFVFVYVLAHEHSNKNQCTGTIIRQCRALCCLPVGRQFCRKAGGNVRRRRVDRSWSPPAPPPRQGTRCNPRTGLSFLKRRKF